MALSPTTLADRLRSEPVDHTRTMRPDWVRTVTSGKAGFAMPVGFIPLLREDALETTRVNVNSYMDETLDLLMNTVNCVASAWFVPKLAFDRFNKDPMALNRSYLGQQEADGSVIPWIVDTPYSGDATNPLPFYKASGMHTESIDGLVNSDYNEAYLKVFEYRCRSRSEALWEAVKDDYTLGDLVPAFFDSPQMAAIKPSFDDAMIDGQVPLTVTQGQMPVFSQVRVNDQTASASAPGALIADAPPSSPPPLDWTGQVWAELEADGISVSVANIDLARETAAWARVRARYSGMDDDQLIDLLMSGVRVPSVYAAQPMLLDRRRVPIGMTQRYATEAENLDVSATRGVSGSQLTLRTPPANFGGVVVIIVEVVPEQFWERSKDHWLHMTTAARRPDRLIDQLDPQAVEIVENAHFDVRHTDPRGIGGYAPLNHEYVRRRFNVGGKFHKMVPTSPWNEDRNRIWASEPVDPTLSKEMYLATDLPDQIFMGGSNVDNFEFSSAGDARISGLTFIGPALREMTDQYQSILDRVDMTRIPGTPVTQLAAEADAARDTQAQQDVIDNDDTSRPGTSEGRSEGDGDQGETPAPSGEGGDAS